MSSEGSAPMQDIPARKGQIRQFILELGRRKGLETIADGESLVPSGIIDSLAIFKLLSFLEDTFRLQIADDEITYENFESIDEIDRFVAGKLEKKPA
jgi:acyl carrier protein